jgi:fructoselysine-6-P-deglycase FrlB-like protein
MQPQPDKTNLEAEIFTAPIVAGEIERMWNTRREAVRAIAQEIAARKPRSVLWFGSGGSAAALYSGYYAMLRCSTLPANYIISPELTGLDPAGLDRDVVAIGASYSGKTVDTLAARRLLDRRGVPQLAITRKPEAELARGAAWNLTYDSRALYSSPAWLSMLLVVELERARGNASEAVETLGRALEGVPGLLVAISEASRETARRNASELDDGKLLVLAGGAACALGYMMAFDMFGEYLKRYCAFLNYGEFRHGPLEIVGQGEPLMMFLMGNDGTRPYAEATLAFARKHGARTVVFDAAELSPGAHPALDALVLYLSQLWLLYFMAERRGLDLDHYDYMHVVPYTDADTFY